MGNVGNVGNRFLVARLLNYVAVQHRFGCVPICGM